MSELIDRFDRKINYLRLFVTEHCNLTCFYSRTDKSSCTASEKVSAKSLAYQEYGKIVEAFASLGVQKVRLTGGEPLFYKNILPLIRDISYTSGVKDVSMKY